MTDDPSRQLARCEGKESFRSGALAREVAQRMTRRGGSVEVYRCQFCNGHHVGTRILGRSQSKTDRRNAR
jgi:hypothetical protein